VLDSRGSTLYAGANEVLPLSSFATRDWRLSPDGSQVAFIEADTTVGLQYRARTVAIDGSAPEVQAQSLAAAGQQLGVAWNPAGARAVFGQEPGAGVASVQAQAASAAGFDVPLGFSADGSLGVVQRWSGTSFSAPGEMQLVLVGGDGAAAAIPGATRFFGWAVR
jgi:hypothetical protein